MSVGNSGTLEFLGGGSGSFRTRFGATLVVGSGFTLSNFAVGEGLPEQIVAGGTSLNTTVSSGGTIVGGRPDRGQLTVSSGGASTPTADLRSPSTGSPAINAGKVEATGGGILFIDSDVTVSGAVLCVGVGAGMGVQNATVSNTGGGLVLVSGTGQQLDLFGGTILGGKLQTTTNAFLLATFGHNAITAPPSCRDRMFEWGLEPR